MTALAAPARRLLVPTLITAVLMAIMVGLGVWQLQRLQWKLGILHAIDAAEASPPVPLVGDPPQFARVVVSGTLRADDYGYYGIDVRGVTQGRFLLAVLDRPDGPPVIVDLGWVPEQGWMMFPHGPATIAGYIRQPAKPGLFTPADNLPSRAFYTLDPRVIGPALGAPNAAPFTLIAMGNPAAIPSPATALPRPPNDHFGYALTWFGLAGTLAVTYALYVRRSLRP